MFFKKIYLYELSLVKDNIHWYSISSELSAITSESAIFKNRNDLWFQQNGTLQIMSSQERRCKEWPPSLPDLSPLDFFLKTLLEDYPSLQNGTMSRDTRTL